MAPRFQQGYKPIQTSETTLQDPLTVRFFRHMDDNANHTLVALSPKIISQVWPGGHAVADAATGTLAVNLMGIWGPFRIPLAYDKISWTAYVDSTIPAGVDVAWEIYCSATLPSLATSYTRGTPLSDDWSVEAARMGSYTVDSELETAGGGTMITAPRGLDITRNADGESYITLMARTVDDLGGTLTRTATIYTLDATAQYSQAY